MKSPFNLLLLTAIFFLLTKPEETSGKRIKNRIYSNLNHRSFCFRRTNGTHQMGCTSHPNGNVGVIHLVETIQDRDYIIEQGQHAPYIPILTPKMFSFETLQLLKDSGKINGVVLISVQKREQIPSEYSDDAKCPNNPSSLYLNTPKVCQVKSKPWNPAGSNVLHGDWPFPIFYVEDSEKVEELTECYRKFNLPGENSQWPHCAVELKSHMTAAIDTKTCIRRNNLINPFSPVLICDPMGDKNLFHLNDKNVDFSKERFEDDSVLLISTRLDTVNLFDGMEVGLNSPTIGIVTLLAMAQLLYNQTGNDVEFQPGKNLLLAFFHGESFDYIGSSRMVFDMKNGDFPDVNDTDVSDENMTTKSWPKIDLSSIKAHIDLGQLGELNGNNQLFVHFDSKQTSAEVLTSLKDTSQNLGLTLQEATSEVLPPSSPQSLLKEKRDIPSIFLSNYDQQYTFTHYHSLYDNASMANYDHETGENSDLVKHLALISETLARFVMKTIGTKDLDSGLKADRSLINDLIYCYTVAAKCDRFAAVTSPDFVLYDKLPQSSPLPQYVSVDRSYTVHTRFTSRLLSYFTAETAEGQYSAANCTEPEDQSVYEYVFVNDWNWNNTKDDCTDCGRCLKSSVKVLDAKSPAFVIEDYDFHNSTYAAWAESSWASTSSRMFLKADPARERGYLALGIFLLITSFISVIWLDKFSSEIFADVNSPVSL